MVEEVSNKFLVFLLLVAIVISLGGTFISLSRLNSLVMPTITGAVSGTGKTNYTISSTASIAVRGTINFGSGFTNGTAALLQGNASTRKANSTGTWDWSGRGLQYILVVNDGNKNVSINISSNSTAALFIGGTSPAFKVAIVGEENKTGGANNNGRAMGACFANSSQFGGAQIERRSFTTVSNTVNVTLCDNLSYFDSWDAINVSAQIVVYNNAPTTPKAALLTFYAKQK